MSATLNGKPRRKQLSDQLDRLDGIIDILADGLPSAVTDATRVGTRQAVREAIVEILSNPELRAMLGTIAPPPAVQRQHLPVPAPATSSIPTSTGPSFWSRARTKLAELKRVVVDRCRTAKKALCSLAKVTRSEVRSKYQSVKQAVLAKGKAARTSVVQTIGFLSALMPLRKMMLISTGVGVVIAAICYTCPQAVSSLIGGIFATCSAVAAQIALWCRRSLGLFQSTE